MSDITFKEKSEIFNPLSANPDKTVKHTQTIRQLLPMNCLSVRDHFVGLALRVNSFLVKRVPLNLSKVYYRHN